jgi:uncharacterized protein YjbI with pentapeptide repeats
MIATIKTDLRNVYMASNHPSTQSKFHRQAFNNTNHLAEQDFSRADIRGIKWKHANLERAKFCQAHAGLSPTQTLTLQFSLIGLSAIAGISAGMTAVLATSLLGAENIIQYSALPGIAVIALTFISILMTVRHGFTALLRFSLVILFGSVIFLLLNKNDAWINFFITIILATNAQIVTLQLGGTLSIADRSLPRSSFVVLSIAALMGAIGFFSLLAQFDKAIELNWLDVVIVCSLMVSSTIIGRCASKSNSPFATIWGWATIFSSLGGTSFQSANLTEADFSQAELKHTDFRNSNLTRTYWCDARGLEFARLDNTYLANPKIRQLVITLDGQNQSFNEQNLAGVNLDEANLKNASFVGTNFNSASLQDTDLRNSILLRTNLTDANLSRADLTGACIKDWSCNDQTCLIEVKCDYVYREFENEQPTDRYPSDRNFQPGEFEALFQKLTNAVELVFQEQVDWRALSFAFEKFQIEDDGMGLELKGVEQRGDYWIVKVAHGDGVSKQQVERRVQGTYDDLRVLMEAKDKQINQLLGIVDGQTRAMNQQAEALTNFSKHPFGNNFFISGSTITNLAGSGQIEYREAADRVRSIVTNRAEASPTMQQLFSQLSAQNVATTAATQQELIQQILLSEAEQDPAFRQFLLEQGQQIIGSLPSGEIAIALQAAIAQL